MEMALPMGPEAGKKEVISGVGDVAGVQVKSMDEVAVMLRTSSAILPVVAPVGTMVVTCVVEALMISPCIPSKVMRLSDVVSLKFLPVMVTVVPGAPC